ncbi:type II secretion system F family protein [bacterium]|nr:type II secretion system F family protein [bacterium]
MEFYYKAKTRAGELKTGSIDAVSDVEAVTKLQNMGFIVLDVSGSQQADAGFAFGKVSVKAKKTKRTKNLKQEEIILFCDQMSVLLESSIDIIKALEILALQVSSQKLYDTIIDMKIEVSGGKSLSEAMSKYPKIFPGFIVNLVQIGESSGQLPDVMKRVAVYLEKADAVKRKIKGALTYPAILVCVSVGAIAIFLVKIIPIFQKIFGEFDIELPVLTQMVIKVSDTLRAYLFFEIIIIAILIIGARKMLTMPHYRYIFDEKILRMPIIGELLLRTAIVNFTTSFSVLLSNGVPIVDALEMVKGSVGNTFLSEIFSKIKNQVKGGGSVSKGLEESKVFPALVVQMIGVGEETGRLTNMLDKISEFYDKRVTAAVETLSAIFEPLILVIMGSIIGVLVISMFLPIFKMAQIGSGGGGA